MCGFAGTVSIPTERADLAALQRASDAIIHRGPDDVGFMSWSPGGAIQLATSSQSLAGGSVAVTHRRLSILDLSEAGRQPMVSADGRHAIAFNGEIYNYLELRDALPDHPYRTRTDTEVLLYGLIDHGVDFLTRLTGMFAFAYFDFEKQTVLFARDFAGIKPLYFYRSPQQLVFGSEMRALLPMMPAPAKANPDLVLDYLVHGLIEHSDQSILAGVHQLCSGSWVEISLETLSVESEGTFWSIPDETIDVSFDEAVAHVRGLFEKNITLHMRSDVPVAATLSGGIDSSAIACMMRALNGPDAEIHSFSYLAAEEEINEEPWSDAVAARAATIQHKVRLSSEAFLEDLDQLIVTNDLPLGNFNGYIGWNLFRATREAGIKVSLDGQGADEMLCGYDQFSNLRLTLLIQQGRLPTAFALYRLIEESADRKATTKGFAKRVFRARFPGSVRPESAKCPDWLQSEVFDSYPGPSSRKYPVPTDPVKALLADDFAVSSLPRLLRCFDRQAMAHSVENRVPFLTPELTEYLFRLPSEYLVDSRGERKKVFRHAIRGLVPDIILERRKKIAALTPNWLHDQRAEIGKRLTADRLSHISLWKPDVVARKWQELSTGRHGDYRAMWRILNLSEWARQLDIRV